jgi:hypothetical protein
MAKKRKEKRKEKASKDLYMETLSHASPQNLHHTYLQSKMLFQV